MTLHEFKAVTTRHAELHGIEGEPSWRPVGACHTVRWGVWSAHYSPTREPALRWVVLHHGVAARGFGATLDDAWVGALADFQTRTTSGAA